MSRTDGRPGPRDADRDETARGGSEPRSAETEHKMETAGQAPTPPEAWIIHEIVRDDGEREIGRSVSSLAWSGFAAGLSMGFSFLTLALVRAGLPKADWAHLVAGFGYPVGFLIAVLGRQQLFTESTLTAVLPFLKRRDAPTLVRTLRLWAVVLGTNLLGTVAFAAFLSYPGLFPPHVTETLGEVASEVLRDSFVVMTMKAVLSGWLIALMVWLLPGAGPARVLLIIILTYVVAIGQLSHVIAGSVEVAFAVIAGQASVGDYLVRFVLPTLIGNTLGGVSLVAILNHAPVEEEIR